MLHEVQCTMMPRDSAVNRQKSGAHCPHPKVHPAHFLELAHTGINQWEASLAILPCLKELLLFFIEWCILIPLIKLWKPVLVSDFGGQIKSLAEATLPAQS
jgi:hypothetical protein